MKKIVRFRFPGIMAPFMSALLTLALTVSACSTAPADSSSSNSSKGTTSVTFVSAVQTGGASDAADSTALTLTFDVDPVALTASNITLTGATKGALTGTGTTRSLAISAITVSNGATVSVSIASPSGYSIGGSPKTAVVYRAPAVVLFQGAVQSGGTPGTNDSTALTLTFDVDPTTLSADNITLTGATKGALSGSGITRSLAISGITVTNGGMVSVSITSPSGYSIGGSPKTAVVYRAPYVGMPYQGGVIGYILQSGDPGYVAGQTHGLIAATADQSTGTTWYNGSFTTTGATGLAIGTGQANTTAIVNNQGAGSYAAKLCDDYVNTDTGTGVYSDWYLPSVDELCKLCQNKYTIGGFNDTGGYWSSTEGNDLSAYDIDFTGNGSYVQDDTRPKNYDFYCVRAVRSF